MLLSVKSIHAMKANVGTADSGIASADIAVARQSRKKSHTTSTASTEPSSSASMAELYWSLVAPTVENTCLTVTLGFSARIFLSSASTLAIAVTSEEPRERDTPNVVAGRPFSLPIERTSSTPSLTVAMSSSRA